MGLKAIAELKHVFKDCWNDIQNKLFLWFMMDLSVIMCSDSLWFPYFV